MIDRPTTPAGIADSLDWSSEPPPSQTNAMKSPTGSESGNEKSMRAAQHCRSGLPANGTSDDCRMAHPASDVVLDLAGRTNTSSPCNKPHFGRQSTRPVVLLLNWWFGLLRLLARWRERELQRRELARMSPRDFGGYCGPSRSHSRGTGAVALASPESGMGGAVQG